MGRISMKKNAFALAVSVALCCAASSARAHEVRDAKAEDVANCTFVADVSAPTTNRKYTRSALGTAMENARMDAHKAGATDIVWDKVTSATVTSVTGKAYKCAK
jgi:hypothetical protein